MSKVLSKVSGEPSGVSKGEFLANYVHGFQLIKTEKFYFKKSCKIPKNSENSEKFWKFQKIVKISKNFENKKFWKFQNILKILKNIEKFGIV